MGETKQRAKDRRPAKTKKAIRLALFELLDKKDLKRITITELTKTADISRKTFYIHYSKIEEILYEFEEELVEAFVEGTKTLRFTNNKKFFFDLFYNLDKYFNDDLEYYKKLAKSSFATTFSDKIGNAIYKKLQVILAPILNFEGEELDYACLIISCSVYKVFIKWLRTDSQLNILETSDFVSKVLFSGLQNHVIED